MEAELKRYDLDFDVWDQDVRATEHKDGQWVRFEDAKKIIEELEATIEKANSELNDSGVEWEAYRDREDE